MMSATTNKFGGIINENQDFSLVLSFKRPIQIEGYAIKTAGEGIDPEHFTLWIDHVDHLTNEIITLENMVSEETNTKPATNT